MALRRQDPSARRARPLFSIWAWLALTPYLLTAFSGAELAGDFGELAAGMLAAVIVHGVLLLAFLLLGATERATAALAPLRWSIVGLGLAGIALGRPALITLVQQSLGVDLVDIHPPLRVLTNAVVIACTCVLIYGVGESLSRAREAERRLRVVLEALAAEGNRIASTGAAVSAAFQRELANEVIDALGALLHRRLPPDVLAKELRWIARSVVQRAAAQARTSSLGEALDRTSPIPISQASETDTSALTTLSAVSELSTMRAGPAWAITFVTTLLFLPPALSEYGPLVGPLELLVAAVASLVLATAIGRIRLPAGRGSALALLATLYLVVGGICCWVLIRPLELGPLSLAYFAYGTVGYALVATIISIIASSAAALRASEQRTASALAEGERERFETQRRLISEAGFTGRLLDSDVQGDILATSFQLEAGTAAPDALDELIDRVESVLRGGPDETPDFAPMLRDGLRATLEAWSLALRIETEIEDAALDWLSRHPGSTAIAHEALTEGLTNSIRYGREPRATVRLRRLDDAIELVVRNPGRVASRDVEGMSLRELEQRAGEVELREDGGEVELRVRIDDPA